MNKIRVEEEGLNLQLQISPIISIQIKLPETFNMIYMNEHKLAINIYLLITIY